MRINGSLLKAMDEVKHSLAVLVIDEFARGEFSDDLYNRYNTYSSNDICSAQQKVLMLAELYNCPIFLIQMDRDLPVGSYYYNHMSDLGSYPMATSKSLRALLSNQTRVINKHTSNAFVDTNLRILLAQTNQCEGVENLVVLGWHSNMCVPATIGINDRLEGNDSTVYGATNYNLGVLTCQQVLSGSDVFWADSSDFIKFYSYL